MAGKIYYFLSSFLVMIAAFILLSPSMITPDLFYPERIDSAYIAFHSGSDGVSDDPILFSPDDLNLDFSDVRVNTNDGIQLKGWYVNSGEKNSNTILILHDLNESKFMYLDQLKQFHDRGFNVCVFDQRAHGNSGGQEYTPGLPAIEDVRLIVDSVLKFEETSNLVIMGTGIGAAIALQYSVYDDRCAGLILQSPFNKYENYLDRYSWMKWKTMRKVWYPVFKRKAESLLQYPVKELDLTEIAFYISIPTLFIIGSGNEIEMTSEALQLFDASSAEKKELFLVRNTEKQAIAKAGGEVYYNKIAAFLLSSLPKEQKVTRYKKLALND
jgi:alpha-beta hydrolase superfamily lysophospholipase